MKIDFHVHTDISPCSKMTLYDAVDAALNKGISGIAICNHDKPFFQSNIPSDMEAKFNITINPNVYTDNAFYIISGIEISRPEGHFLKLFTEDKYGGITVCAHPFEHAKNYQKRVSSLLSLLDENCLIECYSGRANYKNKHACEMAITFAEEFNFKKCGGSDAHFTHEIGNAWTEIDDKIFGQDDIKRALLNGECNFFSKNTKRVTIAESQLIKRGLNFKTASFWCYSFIRDIGDNICQKLH